MTDETTQALLPVTQAARDAADAHYPPHLWRKAARDDLASAFAKFEQETIERHRLAHSLPSQASERQNRLQKYLVDEAQARERLATFPDTVRQRLTRWQEGQSEWFGCTVLEIVAEFIVFEDAALTPTSGEALNQLQAMGQDFDATSGEEMRLREALEAITLLTCVSGDGPTPYLKVHFNDLAAAHAGHDALLAMKRGRP